MYQNGSATKIARSVGANRTTVARWLAGRTEPRLPELLRFVEAATHRLIEFISAFADPQQFTMLRRIHRDLVAQERLAYELPWSHAVLRALELDAYRAPGAHRPGFVAERTGLTPEEEAWYLRELAKAGQIRWRRGRWDVVRVLTVDTRRDPDKNRLLKEHWAEVALRRLRAGALDRGAFFSYNVAAVSHADLDEIRRLHVEYYERVRQVVADSRQSDRVVLVQQELVPLDA
jgi:transcriptional regulator with XRE-family HTH domain